MVTWKQTRLLCALAAVGLLLAACTFYKPLRALSPDRFGLTCTADHVCVEDTARIAEATVLRDDALRFVTETIGPLKQTPRVLFCSSEDCFAQFGNPEVAAFYFMGPETVLINEKSWHNYILRHEFIHHWQVEHFGAVRSSRLPRWYFEGMAYSLSQDPRDPLPRTDIQDWRAQFNAWVANGNDWRYPPEP